MKQGTAQVVLEKVITTLFVLSVNQEQFKDRLSFVYNQCEWPVSAEIQEGFYTFSENTFKMNDVRKLDGRIQANAAQSNQSTQECENYGSRSHGTKACSAAPTTCFFCGKTGHMQKYCRKKGKDISNNKKSSDKYAHHSYPANSKRSSKSLQRTKLLQASANTVESINDFHLPT